MYSSQTGYMQIFNILAVFEQTGLKMPIADFVCCSVQENWLTCLHFDINEDYKFQTARKKVDIL